MAALPDPTDTLDDAARATFDRMAAVRAHAEGRAALGEVYVRMFNNPACAERVGALGELIRFGGTLPGDLRELAILRYAARTGFDYEWAHHVRPALLEGVDEATIAAVGAGEIPQTLPDATRAALEAVDAVVAKRSIPPDVQDRVVAAHGHAGIVELVVLCGLYATMGYMTTAFDISIEDGFPHPPPRG